jgi:hypothetical protein
MLCYSMLKSLKIIPDSFLVIGIFFSMALTAPTGPLTSSSVPSSFFTQTVGLFGRVISSSQGRYLYIGEHKNRKNTYTDIHALRGMRTPDHSFRESEDSSCLRPRGHCDRLSLKLTGGRGGAKFSRPLLNVG